MMTITFESYDRGLWVMHTLRITSLIYDREDATMLYVCDGNSWEFYNPTRNIQGV